MSATGEPSYELDAFQKQVNYWTDKCFGEAARQDLDTRNRRLLEEVMELTQSGGLAREAAHQIVDFVHDRPADPDPRLQVGGALVTLAALATTHGVMLGAVADAELDAGWRKMDLIRAKQSEKPQPKASTAPEEKPVAEWSETNAQVALILAFHGEPEQQEEARRFFMHHLKV
jgi:hypothetical protein